MRSLRPRMLILGLVFALGACSTAYYNPGLIEYRPVDRGVSPPIVRVSLHIIDEVRPRPGLRPTAIGSYRHDLRDVVIDPGDRALVTELMRAATTDALHLAGVAVTPEAPRHLHVAIKEFWWDGVNRTGARVVAELVLRDGETGPTLWRREIGGSAGGIYVIEFAGTLHAIYRRALAAYAENAAGELSKPEVQRHIY